MARRAGPRTLADMTVAVVSRGTGPAWACRLSVVIPLLAAIFLLHGVQCGGDDHGTAHTLMALAAPHAGGMVPAAGPATASGPSGTAPGADLAAGNPAADEPTLRDSSGASLPPLSPGVVCLVLLTAGVVLLAVALRRLGRSDPDRAPGAPSGAGPPVRRADPPSLAQLCLLRI